MDLSTWSPEFDWENLTYKQQVEVLFVTNHLLYDLLDTVCSDDKLFTTPDKGTIFQYSCLRTVSSLGYSDRNTQNLKLPDIFDYPDLLEPKDDLIRHWFDFKPHLLDCVKTIDQEFSKLKLRSDKISVPREVGILASGVHMTITDYQKEHESKKRYQKTKASYEIYPSTFYCDIKKVRYIAGDLEHYLQFKKTDYVFSNLFTIIQVLDKAKGGCVMPEKIAKRVGKSITYVEHAIANLQHRIQTDKKVAGRLRIEFEPRQGYRLISLLNKPQ